MKTYVVIGMLSGLQSNVVMVTQSKSKAEEVYERYGWRLETWENEDMVERKDKP